MKPQDVQRHLTTLEDAAATYRQTLAQLRAQRDVYTPDEVQRREQAALSTFQRSVAAITPELEKASAWAQAELTAVGASDPVSALGSDQLARASARWGFIREDAVSQSLRVLAERCRQAAASGDRVEATLYLRAARQRLHTLDGPERYDGARYDVEAVIPELEAVCLDVERRDAAQAVLDAANTVASRAGSLSYFVRNNVKERLPSA